MPVNIPTILRSGVRLPLLGLGTWKSKPNEVATAVKVAIGAGYRHIDTAWNYGNEAEVGQGVRDAIRDGAVERRELFIVTKLWCTFHRPEDVKLGIADSLDKLGLDYVDMYLMHGPQGFKGPKIRPTSDSDYDDTDYVDTWQAMESLVDEGLTRSLGVSNFNSRQVDRVLQACRIKPIVNQVELHPYLPQLDLIKYCQSKDIILTAYSPFGSTPEIGNEPRLLEDPVVVTIGKRHGKTPAQVLLRYHLERGLSVLAKSITPARILQNLEVFDFRLTEDDIRSMNSLNRNHRYVTWQYYFTKPYNIGEWVSIMKPKSKPNEVATAVKVAIGGGYRHIDAAWLYGNEAEVGQGVREAIRDGTVERRELFIVTKLWSTFHRPEDVKLGIADSLDKLGLDYVDMYLMHGPPGFKRITCEPQGPKIRPTSDSDYDDTDYVDTWKAMESLVDEGLTRSLGVSNFNSRQVDRVLQACRIKPVVNQVELHPYLPQLDLIKYCQSKDIILTAYSPFGSTPEVGNEPRLLEDPVVVTIGKRHGKTPAQVLLRYHLERGLSVLAKSITPARILQNLEVFDFRLTEDDIRSLNSLNRNHRYVTWQYSRTHKYYPFDDQPRSAQ
ncbi:AKR1A1 [Branchiostoma lanceolatum]|uniref:alcohol dehydrogenase (NADP(+)) n=1 Tax=Branchiostoma lanceolatum TaxID=7740 RepID=A0A8K0A6T4_BRALA|nr:AKR1A1 [Branchiostoma lanceolatum]